MKIIIFIGKSYQPPVVNLRTSQRRLLLDEDLSDEAEYNEADDADLHLNKLVKRKILQCNTIDSLPCRRSAFGLSRNPHMTSSYCLPRGATPLTVVKNM